MLTKITVNIEVLSIRQQEFENEVAMIDLPYHYIYSIYMPSVIHFC